MLPVLFPDSILETPTYFVLYLLGFLGAILLATRTAQRDQLSPVRAIDLGMFSFLFGFTGARLFHIFIEAPSYYWEKPIRVFYFWQGGFVLYGGLVVGIVGGYCVVRYWWKESTARWGDAAAAPILLGIGIGRMGCLAAGCCHGTATDWWWGMVFTNPRSGAPLHTPLHPTQLLEALFGLGMAFVLYKVYRKPPKRRGEAFMLAGLSYALFRLALSICEATVSEAFISIECFQQAK